MTSTFVSVYFEVFGIVQGVFFRRETQREALKLGVRGWCRNTPAGTVEGNIEGTPEQVQAMKHWLSKVGSKMSRIDKAVFKNEKEIVEYSLPTFEIRR